jgi:hypothetical protein
LSPLPIGDGIGDQWNLVELTYPLFVGDCGHRTSQAIMVPHGAVERSKSGEFFIAVLDSERVLTELVIAPLSPYGPNSDCTVGIVC